MCRHLQAWLPDSKQKIPLILAPYSKTVVAHDGNAEGLRKKVICCLVFLTQTSLEPGRRLTARRADVPGVLSPGAAAEECWRHPGGGTTERHRGCDGEGWWQGDNVEHVQWPCDFKMLPGLRATASLQE